MADTAATDFDAKLKALESSFDLKLTQQQKAFDDKIAELKAERQEELQAYYGNEGDFLVKGAQNITTKRIFNRFYFAHTDDEIQILKTALDSPIYDIRDGKGYDQGVVGGTWGTLDDVMKQSKYKNTYIYDNVSGTLYYNDNGALVELVTNSITSRTFSVEGNGSYRFLLAHPLMRDVRILVQDNTKNRPEPLYVATEGLCTVSYDAEGIDIVNETSDKLDVTLYYKGGIGAETIDYSDRVTAYVKEQGGSH